MMKRSCGFLLAAVLVFTAGCDQGNAGGAAGRVAVINLDQVAQELGRAEVIQRSIRTTQQEMEDKLRLVGDQLRKQLDEEKTKAGATPTAEQSKRLRDIEAAATEQFRQNAAEAQQRIERVRADQVGKFRDDVRPIARRVAAQHGMGIVMVKQDAMLDVDSASDITNDVIREMKKMESSTQGPTTAPSR